MSESSDLEKLFAARREIDRELMERHAREVAVMFTDIVGSTSFFERKGDIEGLALVKRHNDALFPLVAAHGGRVVKTIGDAIMATFESVAAAARCAQQMQLTLAAMNAARPGDGEIHVRIGIHHGRALLDGGDLFGDTVNVAARVNHEARGDEVLLTDAAARSLPPELGTWARGEVLFKGKALPTPVFALEWGPGAPPPPVAAPESSGPQPTAAAAAKPERPRSEELFVLELARGAEGLRVSVLDGARDKGTVKAFADVPVTLGALDALARGFGTFMHAGPSTYRDEVRNLGERLFGDALSPRAQKRLAQTEVHFARILLEDALVHVPWELLHDGREFLALRFAVGRSVATRAATSPGVRMPVQEVARALVVSNPSGDLPAATREGTMVAQLLREGAGLEVAHLQGPVTREAFLAAAQGAHWLHFAGHVQQGREGQPSGFLCADGVVSADKLMEAVGARAPSVVFANACRASGETWVEAARGISSIASTLLMGGVQHYLGPAWELPDEDGLQFALRFYEHALSGAPLGEAVRRARASLFAQASTPVSFAGYVLYGDPRLALPGSRARLKPQPATRSPEPSGPHAMPTAPITAVLAPASRAAPLQSVPVEPLPPEPVVPRKLAQRAVIAAGLGALVLAGGVGVLLHGRAPSNPPISIQPVPAPSPGVDAPAPAPDPARHTGPLRLVVMPLKNLTGDKALDVLGDAWSEVLLTDLASKDYQLIERGQLETTLGEAQFGQNAKVVDPATRVALGKIKGGEVALVGGYQLTDGVIRVNARFVDVETGEILAAVRRDDHDKLKLQDAVGAELVQAAGQARKKLRP